MSNLSDEDLVKRFEDLLWLVGGKIGQNHNDGGFDAMLGRLKWTTRAGIHRGISGAWITFHVSLDCYDDTGVVFKEDYVNGAYGEKPVYSYGVMREYLPLLEQQVALELLAEISDD